MSDEIPVTRLVVSDEEAERLRCVIRSASLMGGRVPSARVAIPDDAEALADLLRHESIGPKIYTMPDPINRETMSEFITDHLAQQVRGDGILFASFDREGRATAYFDVEVWPQWSIAKFGGAVRSERQGRGFGGLCGLAAVEWCFDVLGVARICETTAPDNQRSIALLARLGFRQLGRITSVRPNGTSRPSIYWEMERASWRGAAAPRSAVSAAIRPDDSLLA